MPNLVNKKLESIRSKFFWGSVENSNKIPWISWNVALASKDRGGLGIGSLYSLNQALIQKWRWRFLNNPQGLWSRLVTAIHGKNNDPSTFFSHIKNKGVWYRIVGSINSMHEKNIIPYSSMQRIVNNGASTKFWHDSWNGNSPLKFQFPRLYRLAMNKDCLVRDCWNNGWHIEWVRTVSNGTNAHHLAILQNFLAGIILNDSEDKWVWSIDPPSFSVKSARCHIDIALHPQVDPETRWNKLLPKKINIFIWRTLRDRLPSRWNLSRKGLEMNSLNCPVCNNGTETLYHSFWTCSLAASVWACVFNWLDLQPPSLSSLNDLYSWIDSISMSTIKRSIIDVISGVVLWSLWSFRNETIFGKEPPKRSFLFDKIVVFSFRWYSSRCKSHSISWNNWIQNPLVVYSL
ncbi:reverse transcriptase domain, Reverse transcriptase zinc-binding domain protein [Artemisia annua]|uniref:Reverse transcriptase domain, Reverse transcriptase zinc-binding domain protein n=1 Tax=Artemisia annua TaxID=35608 RepID=A0A2U1PC80_ARTAN|nr:reverse transcriptase domain, Reverse transcriptase zinc-binding domain protein [Artemisia annua]